MLGLGTWKAAKGKVYNAIIAAIQLGYRHLDCAHIYENEKEIGDALQFAFENKLVQREDLWITSKLWNDSHKAEDVENALRHTLENLQLDYLALYLIHWPVAFKHGVMAAEKSDEFYAPGKVSLGKTWAAIIEMKNKGFSKHIGVSNFNASQIKNIIYETGEIPEMNQIEIHPYQSQESMKELAVSTGFFLTGYKPVGSGGRVTDAMKSQGLPDLFNHKTIQEIANNSKATPAQVLLAWQIQRGIIVIPKSTNTEIQAENLKAVDLELNDNQMAKINAMNDDC